MTKILAACAFALASLTLTTGGYAQQTDGCEGAYKKGVHQRCAESDRDNQNGSVSQSTAEGRKQKAN